MSSVLYNMQSAKVRSTIMGGDFQASHGGAVTQEEAMRAQLIEGGSAPDEVAMPPTTQGVKQFHSVDYPDETDALPPGFSIQPETWQVARERLQSVLDEIGRDAGQGHPRFFELLDEMGELHRQKAGDYGDRAEDPLANLRASAGLGVAPWLGALMRAGDKWSRIQNFATHGYLIDGEKVYDDMRDMAAYLLLAIILKEEADDNAGG